MLTTWEHLPALIEMRGRIPDILMRLQGEDGGDGGGVASVERQWGAVVEQ